eukprot:gnl/TRDRNA2_/TRDRNA2_136413_c0_seq1.p1 gnl/TRDRNA2_/TRDRNA2_136413_c0~~gnl/TRDRNA2_/TRDRNA2_136413_c0_seq1.p1  ORF type:complete len:535 (+),score=71.31 gnl/TRDRNA2_/TRDRNA2_136413_c0_seq1:69-1673(+)
MARGIKLPNAEGFAFRVIGTIICALDIGSGFDARVSLTLNLPPEDAEAIAMHADTRRDEASQEALNLMLRATPCHRTSLDQSALGKTGCVVLPHHRTVANFKQQHMPAIARCAHREDLHGFAFDDPAVFGASATLIGGPFKGVDKWLGGELAADGNIYGVPGSAKAVLKIDPRKNTATEIGDLRGAKSSIKAGKFKWLRGALVPESGDMFGIPCNANSVIRINGSGQIDCIPSFGGSDELVGHWKWHGAVLAANGNLYGCPCNSEHVLKIVPSTGQISVVSGPFPGTQKWYGSLLGKDGCMYAIPNCASTVLKFDPRTETSTLIGNFSEGGWKWHGAAVGGDGNIYGVPAHADQVLKIVVGEDKAYPIGMKLPKGRYKWGGATVAANGDVVCFPSDTGRTLRIAMGVPESEAVTLIGPDYPGKNKWQNGFLGRDNAVYGLPCNAPAIIRISADFEVSTIGGPWIGEEKWEGGVMAPTGVIYAMPQQADAVLRIDPGPPADAGLQAQSCAIVYFHIAKSTVLLVAMLVLAQDQLL